MKITPFNLFLVLGLTLILASCGTKESDSKTNIEGQWHLVSFTNDAEEIELTECDKSTIWNFTSENGEPMGDGTPVKILTATAPEDCEYYGFEAKWTIVDKQLFISTSRIGGMGGSSLAGLMNIETMDAQSLSISMGKRKLEFKK